MQSIIWLVICIRFDPDQNYYKNYKSTKNSKGSNIIYKSLIFLLTSNVSGFYQMEFMFPNIEYKFFKISDYLYPSRFENWFLRAPRRDIFCTNTFIFGFNTIFLHEYFLVFTPILLFLHHFFPRIF